jgi:Zn-dependent protease with chaperone function
MAHEFAHHAHNDIPVGILVGCGLNLGGLYLASHENLTITKRSPRPA